MQARTGAAHHGAKLLQEGEDDSDKGSDASRRGSLFLELRVSFRLEFQGFG